MKKEKKLSKVSVFSVLNPTKRSSQKKKKSINYRTRPPILHPPIKEIVLKCFRGGRGHHVSLM